MALKLPIYLDNSATTPLDPRVVEKMLPYLSEQFGNPASTTHAFGRIASRAVEEARDQVAKLLNADEREIVWTSGATESNNLAIKGAAARSKPRGRHLVTVQTEHKAVLDTMKELERQGYEVTYLAPDPNGLVDLGAFRRRAASRYRSCFGHAGQQRDRRDPGRRCARRDLPRTRRAVPRDAAQATGKVAIDLSACRSISCR